MMGMMLRIPTNVGDAMGENFRNGNDDIESNGRRFQGTPSEVVDTMRILVKPKKSSIS